MSTVNNQTTPEAETYAERCAAIISKFNDKSMPISPWDFKTMLFHSLYDAYIHRDDSCINEDHVTMMYFLWEILDDIEQLVNESMRQ